ncbi:rhodanese-like domain-containing protein [Nitrosarchaeum sp. AC2]|uniref:rhodanese-like domain-containing protein n=1 Tax=Nitrosarchaeum sp. AC2 TaxID=2259673 RepID=UPI0015CC4E46|nr:rhodanese-like domain-containing protein [Nitrosarchaeum sp. AC2]QLH10727.1 rhodanese-like domain-containing protein [Nitrosarchaeum sp. AC2]
MENFDIGLTPSELLNFIKTDNNIALYDLRKKEEFAKGHIKKSRLVKYVEGRLIDVPKHSKIILISKDDKQSKQITITLRSHDIDVHYLIGGINNWPYRLYFTNISYVGTEYL